jgi:hypothetical protein
VWQGSLRVPASGLYAFGQEGGLDILVDDREIAAAPVFLGKGLHSLKVTQSAPMSLGREVARLLWTPPGQTQQMVPASALFHAMPPDKGLLGEYYRGEAWEGEPVFAQLSPLILFAWPEQEPWLGPFSATWTGTLTAPSDGDYLFRLHADDGARLWLDGELLGEGLTPDGVNLVEVNRILQSGPHQIRIDYFQRGGGKALELWWTPPGERHQVVAPEVLEPS